MFSIIVPLYNKENYVQKTIESILNQTYQDFEIIVINDGSSDKSLEIVKGINNNKIIIIDQENRGVSYTRNKGVELAKYPYIAFLDADDWWDPTYLMEMKNLINKFPNEAIYACNYSYVKKARLTRSPIKLSKEYNGYINYFKEFYISKVSPIFTSAIILNKKIFLQYNGFNHNLKIGEDIFLWMKIAAKNNIVFLNKYLSYYNYDVQKNHRAIYKIYPKENYYGFYLDYFDKYKDEEYIGKLLNYLKISSLRMYYRNSLYLNEIKEIVASVNKNEISLGNKIFYSLNPKILKLIYKLTRKSSYIILINKNDQN